MQGSTLSHVSPHAVFSGDRLLPHLQTHADSRKRYAHGVQRPLAVTAALVEELDHRDRARRIAQQRNSVTIKQLSPMALDPGHQLPRRIQRLPQHVRVRQQVRADRLVKIDSVPRRHALRPRWFGQGTFVRIRTCRCVGPSVLSVTIPKCTGAAGPSSNVITFPDPPEALLSKKIEPYWIFMFWQEKRVNNKSIT